MYYLYMQLHAKVDKHHQTIRNGLSMAATQYSEEQIDQYETGRDEWLERSERLLDRVVQQHFRNSKAGEFARTGFGRRLGYLQHAIKRIGIIYPPNLRNASRECVRDAELILQAFVMNVFGAIDNLAWIWASELEVTGPKGMPLQPTEMCFVGSRSVSLVASLPQAVVTILANANDWFHQLGAYRHGIAHQIPIYIPRLYTQDHAAAFHQMDAEMREAFALRNYDDIGPLFDRKHSLGDFGPYMALNGERRPMLLHPQMICDLATVVELGECIFSELSVRSAMKDNLS